MDSIDFSDPLVIAGGAIVAIILVIIIWYATSGSDSASSDHYIWSPTALYTHDANLAVLAGSANGSPLYVAAAPTAAGGITLGKATSNMIWYYDGGEKKVALDQGWLLPASIGTLTWSPTLTRGVALANAPSSYVCRVKLANGIHPGYATGGVAYISVGGKLQTSQSFEYLNVA